MSQGPSILLIDDEAQIRKFLRIALSAQGYRVLEAANGEDGLAQAALHNPDLVVLDLGLPDLDGRGASLTLHLPLTTQPQAAEED